MIYNFIYLIIKMGYQDFPIDLEDFESESDSDQESAKTEEITIFLILKYFPVLINKIIFFRYQLIIFEFYYSHLYKKLMINFN